MSTEIALRRLERHVTTREEAHQAGKDAYAAAWELVADGRECTVIVTEYEEALTVKQRAFLHTAVFPQIAEQVLVDGARFVAAVWKEYFRERFLPDKWDVRYALVADKKTGQLRRAKRKTPHRVRQSTEDLGIKRYSQYIDTVIDTAADEFGVVFVFRPNEREGVRYVAKPRKKAAAPAPEVKHMGMAEEVTA
jgi:hypothetical protein